MKLPFVDHVTHTAFLAAFAIGIAVPNALATTYTFTPTVVGANPWTTIGNWDVMVCPHLLPTPGSRFSATRRLP